MLRYESRNAFIRTSAVMSMIGFVVGLGDRHGENILLDSSCGDVVHVDLNCIFYHVSCATSTMTVTRTGAIIVVVL